MSENAYSILDTGLRWALWTFGALVLASLAAAAFRYRVRRLRLAQAGNESEAPERFSATPEELASVWRALWLSAIASLIVFAALVISPISPIDNFANSDDWKLTPLRLTRLTFQRFDEGFSVEGEVWNQTDEAMQGVAAFVRVWDTDKNVADEVEAVLTPTPIEARSAAHLKVRYSKESPFNIGYDIVFRGPDGLQIPVAKGFDVVQ